MPLKFARQAFGEKPHSSVSDWVDILTKNDHSEESYDGIPELVDAIDLQGTNGSTEASRAIRKKLKHGNAHQQYRALVILKALVDNCGEKFRKIFQDGNLTDALKNLASDMEADKRVKKKLLLILLAWDEQYKDDPNMSFVPGVLKYYGSGLASSSGRRRTSEGTAAATAAVGAPAGANTTAEESTSHGEESDKKDKKKNKGGDVLAELSKSESAGPKTKKDKKDKQKKKKGQIQKQQEQQARRVPFDFEKDKEKVMQSIVEGFQASSNLVNAITLVNTKTDSLQQNERVQECLVSAKKVKTQIVRYVQLVENEDIIGTLIETNDRLMEAVEMYERLSVSEIDPDPQSTELVKALATTHLAAHSTHSKTPSPFDDDDDDDQNHTKPPPKPFIHPDLEDLTFGPLKHAPGSSTSKLPAPMKPSFQDDDDRDDRMEQIQHQQRASLSDFSDYESDSSDEETHKAIANASLAGPSKRNYVTVSDDDDDGDEEFVTPPLGNDKELEDDPFADPFADEHVHSPRRK